MSRSDARKRRTDPTHQEDDMTGPTQRRHEELVALLTEIRDRLPKRPTLHTPDDVAAEFGVDLSDDEPAKIAEEPPVGSQVTDRDGDIWERREGGWMLWWPERSAWSDPYWDGRDPWPDVRGQGPLRFTTDEDRKLVGLPVDTAPADVDPDEALAVVIEELVDDHGSTSEWADNEYITRSTALAIARAAREHIEAEREENQQADAWLRIVRHPVIASVPVPRDGRSFVEAVMDHLTDLHEDVERLTQQRDEWKSRHAALRADVVDYGDSFDAWSDVRADTDDILDRDDERGDHINEGSTP